MSDIPSGALDAGGQPAVPHHPAAPRRTARRPQALHRGVGHQRPSRARRDPDDAGDRRRVRGLVRHVLQRVPRELLATLVDPGVGGAARRADRHRAASTSTGPRPPARGSSWGAGRFSATTTSRGASSSRSSLDPFEDGGWIWFDITTDSAVTLHERRLVRAGARAGHAPTSRSASRRSTGPTTASTRCAALTSDPLVDEVIGAVIVPDQGTRKATRPSRLRGSRCAAGQSAVDSRPAQPRRLRRLQPRHVRGAEEHRLRTDPVHGRRHPHRARLDPAGAGDEPVRQDADAGRRPDAQPAGAVRTCT